jgi:hypothetical protein
MGTQASRLSLSMDTVVFQVDDLHLGRRPYLPTAQAEGSSGAFR